MCRALGFLSNQSLHESENDCVVWWWQEGERDDRQMVFTPPGRQLAPAQPFSGTFPNVPYEEHKQ